MRRDTSLASNYFTAYVPRPDQLFTDGLSYLGSYAAAVGLKLAKGAREAMEGLNSCRRLTGGSPFPQRPVGNAPRMNDPQRAQIPLVSVRTSGAQELLPVEWVHDIVAYGATLEAAAGLTSSSLIRDKYSELGLVDAFPLCDTRVVGEEFEHAPLLPDTVTRSSLITRAAGGASCKPDQDGPSTLFDPLSGFVAGVSMRRPAQGDSSHAGEVIISFSGMGSRGASIGQGLRCFMNILGLTPPKNFQQAAKLTRMVHSHLHQRNEERKKEGLPPYRLTICGHSMGGAMATFAALRLPKTSVDAFPVKTIAINQLRLGLLSRARVGREGIEQAAERVTAVTVQNDWVARWTTLRSAPIGKPYTIPVAPDSRLQNPHSDFVLAAYQYQNEVSYKEEALRRGFALKN